jgi:hypothetical protein
MKKIAYILVLCLTGISAINVSAQGFQLGLKGSTSMAWYKPETPSYNSEGLRLGYSYGMIAEFILAEQYSFASGINIVYLGGKLSFPIEDQEIEGVTFSEKERTYKLQNIEIPFTFKMKTREIGYNTYFAKFGFGGSVNLRAKANDNYYNPLDKSTITYTNLEIKGHTPLFRASMIMGLGFEHSLGGNTALVVETTFNNGFTNTLAGRDLNNVRRQARANYLELTVGILF